MYLYGKSKAEKKFRGLRREKNRPEAKEIVSEKERETARMKFSKEKILMKCKKSVCEKRNGLLITFPQQLKLRNLR